MDTQNGAPALALAPDSEEREHGLAPGPIAEKVYVEAYAQALGKRIRELRGAMSRNDMADLMRVHVNTLGKFERGDSMPDAFQIMRMCEVGKRPIDWLITGHHEDHAAEPVHSTKAVEHGKYVYVPQFDIHASAGNGAFNDVEKVVSMRPFAVNYIRNTLQILHDDIALLTIAGSSSEPVLRSGDTIMVDRRDREVRAEGLHLLLVDDALLVKQVQRLPGRVLRVSSSNESYPPFEIKLEEESQANVDIVGRVRWGGVTFH